MQKVSVATKPSQHSAWRMILHCKTHAEGYKCQQHQSTSEQRASWRSRLPTSLLLLDEFLRLPQFILLHLPSITDFATWPLLTWSNTKPSQWHHTFLMLSTALFVGRGGWGQNAVCSTTFAFHWFALHSIMLDANWTENKENEQNNSIRRCFF